MRVFVCVTHKFLWWACFLVCMWESESLQVCVWVWMCVMYCTYLVKAWLDSSCLRCWESSFFSRDRRIQARARPTSVLISPMLWMCLRSRKRKDDEERQRIKKQSCNSLYVGWRGCKQCKSITFLKTSSSTELYNQNKLIRSYALRYTTFNCPQAINTPHILYDWYT